MYTRELAGIANELVELICAYLPVSGILQLGECSRHLQYVCTSNGVWYHRCAVDFPSWFERTNSIPYGSNYNGRSPISGYAHTFWLTRYRSLHAAAKDVITRVNTIHNHASLGTWTQEFQEIHRHGLAMIDTLHSQTQANPFSDTGLARAFIARRVLAHVNRAAAVQRWVNSVGWGGDGNAVKHHHFRLVDVLAGFDVFCRQGPVAYTTLKRIEKRLSHLASEFAQWSTYQRGGIPAVRVVEFLREKGFSVQDYCEPKDVSGLFLDLVLQNGLTKGTKCASVVLTVIYVALCQRIGLVIAAVIPVELKSERYFVKISPGNNPVTTDSLYIDVTGEKSGTLTQAELAELLVQSDSCDERSPDEKEQRALRIITQYETRVDKGEYELLGRYVSRFVSYNSGESHSQLIVLDNNDITTSPTIIDLTDTLYCGLWVELLILAPFYTTLEQQRGAIPDPTPTDTFIMGLDMNHISRFFRLLHSKFPEDVSLAINLLAPRLTQFLNFHNACSQSSTIVHANPSFGSPFAALLPPPPDSPILPGTLFLHKRYNLFGFIITVQKASRESSTSHLHVYPAILSNGSRYNLTAQNILPVHHYPSTALLYYAGQFFSRFDPLVYRFVGYWRC